MVISNKLGIEKIILKIPGYVMLYLQQSKSVFFFNKINVGFRLALSN